MQAKISYTVNFNDIPAEVNKLLISGASKLQDIAKTDLYVNSSNVTKVIESIDSLRISLLEVDVRLRDCYSILTAYNKAYAESLIPKNEGEENESGQSIPE